MLNIIAKEKVSRPFAPYTVSTTARDLSPLAMQCSVDRESRRGVAARVCIQS